MQTGHSRRRTSQSDAQDLPGTPPSRVKAIGPWDKKPMKSGEFMGFHQGKIMGLLGFHGISW